MLAREPDDSEGAARRGNIMTSRYKRELRPGILEFLSEKIGVERKQKMEHSFA
jgi:hypothetical protein